MPIYAFRCFTCDFRGNRILPMADADRSILCPRCDARLKRVPASFAIKTSIPDHFNPTVGKYVTGEKQFKEELKAQSEAETLRTGIEHNYVPHDPREARDALGVTDEGLEATYRRHRDQRGTDPSKTKHRSTSTDRKADAWL